MTREIWLRRNRKVGRFEVMSCSESLVATPWMVTRFDLHTRYGSYRPPKTVASQVARDFPGHDVIYMGMV